ncbi:MAG: hypothetical protein F6K39_02140 [Okeania sp. SIO3B3]|nr:hypothetical protein [Okeania sp. SIO3B3]
MIESLAANWVEAVGMVAGVQTTLAFLPQAVRVWRTKSAKDISLATFVLFTSGVSCWLAYGLLIHSMSIILANFVTLLLAASILVLKLRYTRQDQRAEA